VETAVVDTEVKRTWLEADQSLPSIAEVKERTTDTQLYSKMCLNGE
jgi:hypothetical protein